MQKILLYYKFVPIVDPEATRLWQLSLCQQYNLAGRILIAGHGLNGSLGGDIKDLKNYIKQTKTFKPLNDMVFKWSDGAREDFPKLSVKVRPEIVTFEAKTRLKVSDRGVEGGGIKLKPKQLHQLIKDRGEDVVFFDCRNAYEASVGKFKKAVVVDAKRTRDFPKELKKAKYDKLKNRPVVTYCTGGIRCEVLSTLMKQEGFKEVYQLDGGIVKYGEEFGDQGLWEGALYVFDRRKTVTFTAQAKTIGSCAHCSNKTSNFENCGIKVCNALILICKSCYPKLKLCPDHQLVTA